MCNFCVRTLKLGSHAEPPNILLIVADDLGMYIRVLGDNRQYIVYVLE